MKQSNEFKKRVCYQIYPASFMDSNNDGWGDIQGIISKLDYLKDLGVGMIWLSPVYVSPLDDMGYDIADYKNINPLFGTMDDFDELLKEAEKRDIKIVMDLVVNHTSTVHKWFKEAIKEEENKYRDYYFIKKGKPNGKMPNNWQSVFSGCAWKKIPSLNGYYYMHLFCDTQADLNYKNEEVVKEVEGIIKFWLDKGVYGFRCDVINHLYKTSLKDDHTRFLYGKGSKYYLNQEGMYEVLGCFRSDVLDNYDTFLVGETGSITTEIGKRLINDRCLDMFFEFEHLNAVRSSLLPVFKKKLKPKNLMNIIYKWQKEIPRMAVYFENHDQLRLINVYGDPDKYRKESAKMMAMLLLTLKGTPFIYQGQEIGMMNNPNLTLKETNDICAHMVAETFKKIFVFSKEETVSKRICETLNRDQARSPMQWNENLNGGFNKGAKTWIPIHDDFGKINVEKELKEENSILNFYKEIIAFRNQDEVLLNGEIEKEIFSNSIVAYKRIYNKKSYLVLLNFSKKKAKYAAKVQLNCKICNYKGEIDFNNLSPYFAGLFEIEY